MKKNNASLRHLLSPYLWPIGLLSLLAIGASGLGLLLPKVISGAIDSFITGKYETNIFLLEFSALIISIFILTYLQSIVQTITSERVARDLRKKIIDKISKQEYLFIEKISPAKLLTNLTTDINAIKMFIGLAMATLISSVVIIIGAAIFLLNINWQLGLVVLTMIPIIGGLFALIFGKVKILMKKSREIIDWLNRVINESILGASLIRVLHLQAYQSGKFQEANASSQSMGISILKMFASLIPIVMFVSNLATIAILTLGGHFIITGTLSLGNFTAFNSYVALLIFPILTLGMMSNMIAQAAASYERIYEVLTVEDPIENGTLQTTLKGKIEVKNVTLQHGEKKTLKNITFHINPKSKVAIVGPTAAGKTQLLNILIGLTKATSGTIKYDGNTFDTYAGIWFHRQIGFVFQNSVLFNLSLRENIAFGDNISQDSLEKAIHTAELHDFITTLPKGIETTVSERGTSLSGGQKQRIMLARALALDPKILLLDDFTARLDAKTEGKILANIAKNYPEITLISVTQKISSIEQYDNIIVLMEGELVVQGTHTELMESSPEYVQIYNSQQSTNQYE